MHSQHEDQPDPRGCTHTHTPALCCTHSHTHRFNSGKFQMLNWVEMVTVIKKLAPKIFPSVLFLVDFLCYIHSFIFYDSPIASYSLIVFMNLWIHYCYCLHVKHNISESYIIVQLGLCYGQNKVILTFGTCFFFFLSVPHIKIL